MYYVVYRVQQLAVTQTGLSTEEHGIPITNVYNLQLLGIASYIEMVIQQVKQSQ